MAILKISLKVGTTQVSDITVNFPNADANAMLDAYRKGTESDGEVFDGVIAQFVDQLGRDGNAAELSKRIATAVANVQANFAARQALRADPVINNALAAARNRDAPTPPVAPPVQP